MEDTNSPQGGSPQQAKRRARVYEQWQGNETFFCWGYLVAGPNWKASIGTAFLLLAPTGIFLAFVAPYVMRHVHVIIMVFSCILPALSFGSLFLTACRDPGIIPRQEPDEEYLQGRKARTKEVFVNGHKVVIRYNDTCHFYQPPRAHHCSVNDNCIERFDHHCPWVGTTIGKRNYRTFLIFIYITTVYCLYVFGVCLAQLFVRHRQLVDEAQAAGESTDGLWGRTVGDVVPAIVLMAYTFIFFWFVGGLSGFHAYLVSTNQTTYENFRYNHDSRPNPYDRGLLHNCAEVWCTPTPPSHVNFRAYVDEVSNNRAAWDIEAQPQHQGQQQQHAPAVQAMQPAPPPPPQYHQQYTVHQQQALPPLQHQGQQQHYTQQVQMTGPGAVAGAGPVGNSPQELEQLHGSAHAGAVGAGGGGPRYYQGQPDGVAAGHHPQPLYSQQGGATPAGVNPWTHDATGPQAGSPASGGTGAMYTPMQSPIPAGTAGAGSRHYTSGAVAPSGGLAGARGVVGAEEMNGNGNGNGHVSPGVSSRGVVPLAPDGDHQ